MTQDYGKAAGSALQASGAIPEKWSRKVRNKGYPGTVLSSISTTDYSKDVKKGSRVKIRTKFK